MKANYEACVDQKIIMIDGVLIDVKDEATRSPYINETINDSCSYVKDCYDKSYSHEKDIL